MASLGREPLIFAMYKMYKIINGHESQDSQLLVKNTFSQGKRVVFHSRGATRLSRGYQARPKIHVIRVVFQDQALYARTSFRGAKTCKIGKKGLFLVI